MLAFEIEPVCHSQYVFLETLDINMFAASTVFITAGVSACTSAQAAVLADW